MVVPLKTKKHFMASFHSVFLFILVCFINFVTTKAKNDDIPSPLMSCSTINKTTLNSTFELNLRTLLSDLSSNATAKKEFYNSTVTDKNNSSNTIYGQFMCKGDVPAHLCSQCVSNLTRYNLSSDPFTIDCFLSKEVTIGYDECMVRYSSKSFFSPTHFSSGSSAWSPVNVSNQAVFERLVFKTLNDVADEAARFSIGVKKYATKEATISEFQTLYFQAQCTPDLSPQDCRKCLNVTMTDVLRDSKSNDAEVGNSETYNCYIRYDVYPFYRPSNAPTPQDLVPASNKTNSKYSEHPDFLSNSCSSNETMNNDFLSNLRTLFSSLSSNAIRTGFFKTTVDTVNGLFMCRGDISLSPTICQLCVQDATKRISSECPTSKEAIIWYDKCLLHYSHHSLLSGIDASAPKFHQFNMANASNLNQLQSFTNWKLAAALHEVEYIHTDESTIKNYETKSVKLNDHQTLYTLVQCTPDLSDGDCSTCLKNIFQNEIPWRTLASPEGNILYPSCYMMFGLSQFYNNGDEPEAFGQVSPPPTTKGEVSSNQYY